MNGQADGAPAPAATQPEACGAAKRPRQAEAEEDNQSSRRRKHQAFASLAPCAVLDSMYDEQGGDEEASSGEESSGEESSGEPDEAGP